NKNNNNNQNSKKRVYWIDWLRVLACYLVVFLHCSFFYVNIDVKTFNGMVLSIYYGLPLGCVPLFILISGSLFLNPKKKIPLKVLYGKYIRRLFISLVFWSLYYNLINEYIVNVGKKEHHFNLEECKTAITGIVLGKNGGHLWYLFFVIGLYILTPIYKCITEKRDVAWYFVIYFIIIYHFIPTFIDFMKIFFNFNLSLVDDYIKKHMFEINGYYSAYYILGYLLNTQEFKNKKYITYFYIIGIVGFISTHVLRFSTNYIQKKHNRIQFSKNNNINITMTVLGVFLFFKYKLSNWINNIMENNKFINKLILKLSECSFGIYLAHMAVLDIIVRFTKLTSLSFNPLFWMPIFGTLVFTTTATVIFLLRFIPFF
ncbi:hypothetical protein BCR36DRAFT_262053, partial [Piromyces finnis]